ncbi:MAG: ATP synthase F1 subunit delta [Lachnospiraceae bacterium]|nr:ATP synthase F1 subunit delta [Lachnospiraceae bacterium]
MTERAGIYGGSLYDLAAEENLTETIKDQLIGLKAIFRENPEYLRLLSEPAIKKAERLDLIDKSLGGSCEKYLINFIKLLCERGLLGEFEGCCDTFVKRYNTDHNIAEAVVTSAVQLNDSQLSALKAKLEARSGKTVTIAQKLDPKVLAGIRVELEGVQLDGTLSGRLSGIGRKLEEVVI